MTQKESCFFTKCCIMEVKKSLVFPYFFTFVSLVQGRLKVSYYFSFSSLLNFCDSGRRWSERIGLTHEVLHYGSFYRFRAVWEKVKTQSIIESLSRIVLVSKVSYFMHYLSSEELWLAKPLTISIFSKFWISMINSTFPQHSIYSHCYPKGWSSYQLIDWL